MLTVKSIMITSIKARRMRARRKVRGTVQLTTLTTSQTKSTKSNESTICGSTAQKPVAYPSSCSRRGAGSLLHIDPNNSGIPPLTLQTGGGSA